MATTIDLNERQEYAFRAARPAVLEPLHHSDSFVDGLGSPELSPSRASDPFLRAARAEEGTAGGDEEEQQDDDVSDDGRLRVGDDTPRHLRLGSEWRRLRKSRTRLLVTVLGLVGAWMLCVVLVAFLRTGDYW